MQWQLPTKYRPIFELAKPFYKKGREMDEFHHLVVAEMVADILQEYPTLDTDVMMAAALFHDTGYAKIPPEERETHWAEQVVRDHMRYGSEIAKEILQKNGYPKETIDRVCAIIETHDNPTIGLPIDSEEGKVLKEADILWMTTEEPFWLDVKRRPD